MCCKLISWKTDEKRSNIGAVDLAAATADRFLPLSLIDKPVTEGALLPVPVMIWRRCSGGDGPKVMSVARGGVTG